MGSKFEKKKMLLSGEGHQLPSLTALATIHHRLFSSQPSLDHNIPKGSPLDCLVPDCSNTGCMRVSLVFGGLVVRCGEDGLLSTLGLCFGSQAVL